MRVEQLLDDRRGRERLARQRLARDVREVEAIARAEQELEERVLVALARRHVALAPPRPAQIERVLGVGRRELPLAHAAGEDDAERAAAAAPPSVDDDDPLARRARPRAPRCRSRASSHATR